MVLKHRLSAVIGPSGSGKSSLVLAGLLPALDKGAAHQSETWVSVKAVPGGYPFDELATALSALSTESLSDLATELAAEDGKGLLRVAKRIGIELDGDLVIVLDQFEELFTLVASDRERNHFVSTLVTAASDPLSKVRIVLTLRADFFHQVLSHPELGPVISLANLALAPLDSERIRLAIVEPARKSGLELEPGLADRIIADLADQPGSLPLLQFTLDRLATLASDGRITNAEYDALGGVKGALAERAQTAYQTLTERQQAAAQQIFTRLLTVSDETDDVRRRVRVTELKSLGLPSHYVNEVLDSFGKERLLTFDIDPVTRGATVEVAHEALLREWPTLRTWVDSRRESLVLQRRFQAALEEWEESDRSPSNLLTGGKLSQYEEWAAGQDVTLTAVERAFLVASIERRTGETRERRARRRRIMAGFAGAAVVALLLAVVAFLQRGQAEENAALAQARELILEAEKNVTVDPELAMLLSLEAIEAFRASGQEAPPSAQAVLRRGMAEDRVVARFPGGRWVDVSYDGTRFATRGEGGSVVIRAFDTGEVLATLSPPAADPGPGLFHPSGNWLAGINAGGSGTVRVWDLRTQGSFFDIGPPGAQASYFGTKFSPGGDLIVIQMATDPETLEVWSFPEGELKYSLGPNLTRGSSFSGDGRLAFVEFPEGESPTLRILEAATGAELQTISLDGLNVPAERLSTFTAFSPDGGRLAIADQRTVAMIDLTTQERIWRTAELPRAFQPEWLQDGERLFVGGENLVSILDAATGEVIEKLPGHGGGTWSYAAVPGTDWVASGGLNDEETVIFDLGQPVLADLGTLSSEFSGAIGMASVGDGSRFAVRDRESNGVIDAKTGELIYYRPGRPERLYVPVFSANGLYTAGSDAQGGSRLWSNLDGQELFAAPEAEIRGMSEDGTLVVLVDLLTDRTQLVSIDGAVIAELDVVPGQWWAAVFSADGRYVATNTDGAIQIWDTSTGAELGSIEEYDLLGTTTRWTPDGSLLIVAGYNGIINVFDVGRLLRGESDRESIITRIPAHDTLPIVVDLKDGSIITVTKEGGEPIKVWDYETGEKLGEFFTMVEGNFVPAAFHPTEPRLYVEVDVDQIGIFTLDVDELMEIARSRLSRDLIEEECQLYLRRSCEGGT
jgi:WD40 repeat protein